MPQDGLVLYSLLILQLHCEFHTGRYSCNNASTAARGYALHAHDALLQSDPQDQHMGELVSHGEPLSPSVDLVADSVIAAGTTTHCEDLDVLHRQDMLSTTL